MVTRSPRAPLAAPDPTTDVHPIGDRRPVEPALRSAAATHVGDHPRNEDHFARRDDLGLYVVADGLGGPGRGELASRLAVTTVCAHFDQARDAPAPRASPSSAVPGGLLLRAAVRRAHHALVTARAEAGARLASTLAALHVEGDEAHVAHVGDSRVHRLRGLDFVTLTVDHVLGSHFSPLAPGEQRAVTRALGTDVHHPQLSVVGVEPGDLFLLASDGLTDVVPPNELAYVLHSESIEDAPRVLLWRAIARGARDDITALVVAVGA